MHPALLPCILLTEIKSCRRQGICEINGDRTPSRSVIARLDRAIQYAAAFEMKNNYRWWLLIAPLEAGHDSRLAE
jgi:hypothetical protein